MLNTLRKIVQEVNSAKDLKAALGIIVQRVKEAMGTQVCSVYLLDTETQRFVLMATEGLNKRSIGKVSMAPSEGLVGLVGTREEPLNLENAAAHPRYRYFAETGEERYASFLGAPIIHHRRVMGVLVVQQKERRQFDEGEEAFLVTMSAQLAGVIAHAEATGSIRGLGKLGKGIQEAKFVGVPGAPGVGVGKAVVVLPPADLEVVPDKQVDDIDAEIALFKQALEGVRADMRALSSKLASQLRKEERALFDVYLMMLDDASIGNEVKRIIRTGQWAQGALRQVVMEHVQRFELMDDAYLRERASDVKDIGRRLLAYLQEERKQNLTYPEQTIIVSEELSPAMLGEVPEGRLVGLVSVLGSGNSHVAILARAMGIPTVMGAVDLPYSKVDGIDLIVDGSHGEVYTNPSAELVRQYSDVVAEERELSKGLADQLNPRANRDAVTDRWRHSDSQSLFYSLPWGWWTFTYGYSQSDYRTRNEASGFPFKLDGDSRSHQFRAERVLHRDGVSKTAMSLGLSHQRTNNYVEDTRLEDQSTRITETQLGFNHGRRIGSGFVNLDLGWQQGIGALGAQGRGHPQAGDPNARYDKYSLTLSYLQPFQLWGERFSFDSLATGQRSEDVLFSPQRISLGGNSSVRGFKDQTLTGDSGGYWRNQLRWRRAVEWAPLRPWLQEYGVAFAYDVGVIRHDRYNDGASGRMSGNAIELDARGRYFAASVGFARSLERPSAIERREHPIYFRVDAFF